MESNYYKEDKTMFGKIVKIIGLIICSWIGGMAIGLAIDNIVTYLASKHSIFDEDGHVILDE
jgi:hypothetical protein